MASTRVQVPKEEKKAEAKTEGASAVASKPSDGNAVLVTGATHARELFSSQVPLFLCLKLIHQGILQNNPRYQ